MRSRRVGAGLRGLRDAWLWQRRHGKARYGLGLATLLATGLAAALALSQGRRTAGVPDSPLVALRHANGTSGVLKDPIDAHFLTDVPFGTTSFWLQPWRAYLDTWPASRLTNALGINFNVKPAQAQAVARLLHESGFTLARIEIPWGSLWA